MGQQAPCKFCAKHAGYKGHDALSNVGDDVGSLVLVSLVGKVVGDGVGSGVGRLVLVSLVGTGVGDCDDIGRGVGFCQKSRSNKQKRARLDVFFK